MVCPSIFALFTILKLIELTDFFVLKHTYIYTGMGVYVQMSIHTCEKHSISTLHNCDHGL